MQTAGSLVFEFEGLCWVDHRFIAPGGPDQHVVHLPAVLQGVEPLLKCRMRGEQETEGKAITLADTGMERNAHFRRYVKGRPEQVTSSFNDRNPGTWLMKLLAQVKEVYRTAVVDLVVNTYGGYLATLADPTWRQKMSAALDNLLTRMQTDGLIEQERDMVRLTMLGRACGESPLTLESAMRLVELLRSVPAQMLTLELLPVSRTPS